MNLDELKTVTEIIQNVIASVAILVAGLWTFYIFVLGRSYSPHVQILVTPKYIYDSTSTKYTVLKLVAKNVGRTKATKDECYLAIEKIPAMDGQLGIRRIDSEVDFSEAKLYTVFLDHTILEPNEEVSEELAISFDETTLYKVKTIWYGDKFVWSSTSIFRSNQSES